MLIFIDSLDQLDNNYDERSQPDWIPMTLPAHAYVVVSTLPDVGDCYHALRQMEIPEQNFLEVAPLVPEDTDDILTGWLANMDRALQVKTNISHCYM